MRPNIEADSGVGDFMAAEFSNTCTVQRSMIAAGCTIEGTVVNSILSPGVTVRAGAEVRDSIIFHDCTIESDAVVDHVICDKKVTVKQGCVIGEGDGWDVANEDYPKHLSNGITLIGREAELLPGIKVGRNCIINPWTTKDMYRSRRIGDGRSV